MYTSTAHNRSN